MASCTHDKQSSTPEIGAYSTQPLFNLSREMLGVKAFGSSAPRRYFQGRVKVHARTPSDFPSARHSPERQNNEWTVSTIMTKNPICVSEDTPLAEVARTMNSARISGVPVLSRGHVIGILSETDLLLSFPPKEEGAKHEYYIPPIYIPMLDTVFSVPKSKQFADDVKRMLALDAGDLMSTPAITVCESASVGEAARVMIANKVNRLPVVDRDKSSRLVGVVTRDDIVSFMAAHQLVDELE